MRLNIILQSLAVACIVFAAQAAQPIMTQEPTEYPQDLSANNLQIVSTEHTAEYLTKTTGTAESSPYGSYRKVAGNWTFELRDQKSRPIGNLNLQLFQIGGVVFGKGALKNGLREQTVTADGSLLEGNAAILNVVTIEDTFLYALSINIGSNNILSGSFRLFTPGGSSPITGTVYGGSNEPRGFSN